MKKLGQSMLIILGVLLMTAVVVIGCCFINANKGNPFESSQTAIHNNYNSEKLNVEIR